MRPFNRKKTLRSVHRASALAVLVLSTAARGATIITTNTDQIGGTFTVSPPSELVVSGSSDPQFGLLIGATTSGVSGVVIGTTAYGNSGQLDVDTVSVLTNSFGGNGGTYSGVNIFPGAGYLGLNSGSTGTAMVTNGSFWTNSSDLYVGYDGTGSLTVASGGLVSDPDGVLGTDYFSTGSATVAGAGSNWINTSNLVVGEQGTGSLQIDTGGNVSAAITEIGLDTTGVGTVTVAGTGALLNNTVELVVGDQGTGTLNVVSSGTVQSSIASVSANGTLNIAGGNVLVTSLSIPDVNFPDFGNLPDPSNLGDPLNAQTNLVFTGGTLQVSGGTFTYGGFGLYLSAGNANESVLLALTNGATGNITYGLDVGITYAAEANGQEAVLAPTLPGNVAVASGSSVTTSTASVLGNGSITVTDKGSSWNGDVEIIGAGTLTVQAGASLNGGVALESANSTFTLTDAGSNFTGFIGLTDGAVIGLGSGTFNVENGATATTTTYLTDLGTTSGAAGAVNVTGTGATWNTGTFMIGDTGTASLTIQNGGTVKTTEPAILFGFLGVVMGNQANSSGAITVSGTGSSWTTNGGLTIGDNGSGSLTVSNGALVSLIANGPITGGPFDPNYSNVGVGANAGSTGSVTVSGSGSVLSIVGGLGIGANGSGTLLIQSGGEVSSIEGGVSGTATITGPASTWNCSDTFGVDSIGGSPATLTISNSGQLNVTKALLVFNSGVVNLNGGHATVGSLTVDTSSFVNVNSDSLIINYATNPSPVATIRGYLISGYNNGAWNGPGINSTTAATHSQYAVGYADGNIDTKSVAKAGEVLVELALVGDTNLDKTVNLTDLLNLLNDYGQSGQDWAAGDFNYDGTVNLTDLLGLLNNYGQTATLANNSLSSAQVVPEPAAVGLIVVGMGGLLRRRRMT